jgi:hypothetical protein
MTILPRPPENWKRPAMPAKVRLQVVINQEGRCKATGEKLGHISDVEFDHRPALYERQFDTEANDTVPASNDAAYIEAIRKDAHKARTARDSGRRAKENRITGKTKGGKKVARFKPLPMGEAVGDAKPGRPEKTGPKISSRGFDKRYRRGFNGKTELRT